MTKANKKPFRLLPFSVLTAATCGDADAVNAVLKHYERYIIVLSMKRMYDENGREYICIDEDKRRSLETKLIKGILNFDVV